LSSLLFLNFLRSAVTLAAISGAVGAAFLTSSFWASTHISIASASRLFFLILTATWSAWSILNWFLSLSTICAITENAPALSSIAESVALLQRRPGPMIVTGIIFAFIHLGAFLTATSAAFIPLSTLGAVSPALAWLSQVVILASYSAIADFLYTARMAAYVFIIRAPEPEPVVPESIAPTPPSSARIDPNELILSDIPVPAT
jgi:hypothetical protein